MTRIKNIVGIILLSAGVSFAVIHFFGKKETIVVKEVSSDTGNQLVNLPGISADANINFTIVAENAVSEVVHVTSKMVGQSHHDPLYSFFYGRPAPPHAYLSSGSGVIISEDGYIVTNNHVVKNAEEIEVVLNNRQAYTAELIGQDPTTDLALLKIKEQGLLFMPYGNSDETKVGEWVLAVGNPFNLTSTVTAGIVSAKGRNINILGADMNTGAMSIESFIQTDAAVNPGNSGGALVNTKGELVGINSAIKSSTGSYVGYSFAIPVNIVKKVIEDLKEFGTVQRAFIGVNIKNIDQKLADEYGLKSVNGIFVTGTTESGAAEDVGIKKGDVIMKVGSVMVNTVSELQEQVNQFRPGDEVVITLNREGTEIEKKLTLKNFRGGTEVIKKEAQELMSALGARFEDVSKEEKEKLGIAGGAKVVKLWNGKMMRAGIKEGFIVTRIDKENIKSSSDVAKLLEGKKGGVLFEGIYPNGKERYYGFGM